MMGIVFSASHLKNIFKCSSEMGLRGQFHTEIFP